MKLLVVAATEAEIKLFTEADKGKTETLITGVGMTATTYALTRKLQTNKYDLVIQAGVGGSFDRNIELGTVVFVNSDRYGDLGAEDHDDYLDIFDLGLLQKDVHPFKGGMLYNPLADIKSITGLRETSGLTVNTVSGNERTIECRAKYGCTVESMEGAAFHYVCLMENVPFAQIRSISNYVMPRDKNQWKMKEAIINLNNWLIDFTTGH
jgi:futalosine hydrolase